jgi:hypothetical protein
MQSNIENCHHRPLAGHVFSWSRKSHDLYGGLSSPSS